MRQTFFPAARQRRLRSRALILSAVRGFFRRQDFLEVDTPYRIPAPIPECHIDLMQSGSWFLHPSPEICMKRMLSAGFERIYQICHCWRDGERGRLHLPEFTMLEWYRSQADYTALMDDCKGLITFAAEAAGTHGELVRKGKSINLDGPWEKLSVREAFVRYGGIEAEEALDRDLFDEIMVRDIEPRLGLEKPTFLVEYPAERGSLARLKPGDPGVAERFELYIGGLELANAFSELCDPVEQRERFCKELSNRAALGKTGHSLPEKFLRDLAEMPPSAGIALGLDRLVMLLLDAATIDEVVAFIPEEL
ncbi:MAG: EF-P lysine aminoacylase EpmA [Geobacteraceae bacterium]|nr:EF-P lysine aminoacylase EpmA [Geobacteraceae bacterium]